MESFDLVILGSGSTAFAAAIRAAELGKTAVMTENRTLGGTCVNRGCLPSKNLIEAARIYWEALRPRYPGLRSKGMEIDFRELIRQKDEVIHDYRDKKYQSIVTDADRIKVYTGRAAFIAPDTVEVDGRRLAGKHFLIATGSRPVVPPIEGLAEVPSLTSDLLTSDEPMELWDLPRSLVIVGGGYIALELGQMFQRRSSGRKASISSPRRQCEESSMRGTVSRSSARAAGRKRGIKVNACSWRPAGAPTPMTSAWSMLGSGPTSRASLSLTSTSEQASPTSGRLGT